MKHNNQANQKPTAVKSKSQPPAPLHFPDKAGSIEWEVERNSILYLAVNAGPMEAADAQLLGIRFPAPMIRRLEQITSHYRIGLEDFIRASVVLQTIETVLDAEGGKA